MTAVRSRPAACPPCCPAAARSPTPRPASTPPPPGASTGLPETPGRDADAIVAALRRRRARRPGHRRRRPRRHRRPGRRPARRSRPRRFVVALELRETDVTRAADVVFPVAPGHRQGRHVRHLGGPPAPVRGGLHQPGLAAGPADPGRHRRGAAGPRPAGLPHRRRGPRPDAGARPVGRRARRRLPRPARRARGRATGRRRRLPPGHLEADARQRLDAGRRRRAAGHGPRGRSPASRRARRTTRSAPPVTVTGDRGSVTLPAEAPPTSSTAWCGCRPTPSAAASSPTWPRPGSRGHREGSRPVTTALIGAPAGGRPAARRARRLRPGPLVAHRHQDPADLRDPGAAHAVQHLVGAPGRGPDAAPHRPQRQRPVRAAAVAGRRREAGAQGGHHPEGRRQGGLPARAGDRGDPGVRDVLGDPVRPGRRRAVHRPDHAAAAHRHAGRGAVRDGDRLDRHLRHRARRLVQRLDVLPARRPALQRPDDLLRGRDGPRPGRGLPVRRLDVDLGDRGRAGPRSGSGCPASRRS